LDLLYDALLVLILVVLASWLVMLGAAVVRCLRDGEQTAAERRPLATRH
jgi:hypothetical protein